MHAGLALGRGWQTSFWSQNWSVVHCEQADPAAGVVLAEALTVAEGVGVTGVGEVLSLALGDALELAVGVPDIAHI